MTIIRPAVLADAEAIGNLEIDVWADPVSGLPGDIPSAHIDLCNTIRFGWAFVVDADCTCGRLRCERDGLRAAILATPTRDGDVLVADLCVREDCRRLGFGARALGATGKPP